MRRATRRSSSAFKKLASASARRARAVVRRMYSAITEMALQERTKTITLRHSAEVMAAPWTQK